MTSQCMTPSTHFCFYWTYATFIRESFDPPSIFFIFYSTLEFQKAQKRPPYNVRSVALFEDIALTLAVRGLLFHHAFEQGC